MLVTGAAGFVGSYLCEVLLDDDEVYSRLLGLEPESSDPPAFGASAASGRAVEHPTGVDER